MYVVKSAQSNQTSDFWSRIHEENDKSTMSANIVRDPLARYHDRCTLRSSPASFSCLIAVNSASLNTTPSVFLGPEGSPSSVQSAIPLWSEKGDRRKKREDGGPRNPLLAQRDTRRLQLCPLDAFDTAVKPQTVDFIFAVKSCRGTRWAAC